MTARSFSTLQNGFDMIRAEDLPAINTLNGALSITQIDPTGVTGQIITDIGASGLRWRHITSENLDPTFKSGSGVIPLISLSGLASGDIPKWNGSTWVNTPDSTGTVTSVALTAPSEISVTGSPVTSSGTLALSWADQTTNKVFASPNGSTGTPTFRALATDDLANDLVTYAKIQNVSATNRLLGRSTAGAGDIEELQIGTGLSLSGGTLSNTVSAGIASINGDTTSAQTIVAGTDLSVTTASGVTTVTRGIRSGSSYYWIVPTQFIDTTSTAAVGAANRVHVHRFYLPFRFTITVVTFRIATGVAASNASIGVYSDDGTARYIDTGPQSSATGSTTVTVTLGSPVTLPPGYYWFALTCSSTTPTFLATGSSTFFNTTILNDGTAHLGRAANTSSAGQLPATLGSITSEDRAAFICKLQG